MAHLDGVVYVDASLERVTEGMTGGLAVEFPDDLLLWAEGLRKSMEWSEDVQISVETMSDGCGLTFLTLSPTAVDPTAGIENRELMVQQKLSLGMSAKTCLELGTLLIAAARINPILPAKN